MDLVDVFESIQSDVIDFRILDHDGGDDEGLILIEFVADDDFFADGEPLLRAGGGDADFDLTFQTVIIDDFSDFSSSHKDLLISRKRERQ